MRVGNVFGHVCVCVCVCLSVCLSVFLSVQAITLEPLDIETSFFGMQVHLDRVTAPDGTEMGKGHGTNGSGPSECYISMSPTVLVPLQVPVPVPVPLSVNTPRVVKTDGKNSKLKSNAFWTNNLFFISFFSKLSPMQKIGPLLTHSSGFH